MPLVAYDASSDEDDAGDPPAAGPAPPPHLPSTIGPQQRPMSPSRSVHAAPQHPAPPPAPTQTLASTNSSNVSLPAASFELPDVADLFDSPSLPPGGFPAMVGSSSRKRESNGSAIPPRSKFPRGQSAQTRGARNAATSTLVPPQLSGRSNVVTEDMGKLFVARRMD
uniref:Uncharacterized protein n=1 Tax=Avena sativa TaxID=4498 RepID=A0ACD5WMD1_AVESA